MHRVAIERVFEHRRRQHGAYTPPCVAGIVREFIYRSRGVFHEPQLYRDGRAVQVEHAQAQPSRRCHGVTEFRHEIGIWFRLLPATAINFLECCERLR